jgi:hypothetical protein
MQGRVEIAALRVEGHGEKRFIRAWTLRDHFLRENRPHKVSADFTFGDIPSLTVDIVLRHGPCQVMLGTIISR